MKAIDSSSLSVVTSNARIDQAVLRDHASLIKVNLDDGSIAKIVTNVSIEHADIHLPDSTAHLSQLPQYHSFVQHIPRHFLFRPKEIGEIIKKFNTTPYGIVAVTGIVGVHGGGGIGKTQIAKYLANLYMKKGWGLVWWVDCKQISSMDEIYKELAGPLGISTKERSAAALSSAVIAKLKSLNENWFIVLDDVSSPRVVVADKLPKSTVPGKQGRFLITSRHPKWREHSYALHGYLPADALRYCEKHLSIDGLYTEKEAHALINDLKCHPLALAQAVGYIKIEREHNRNFTITNYRKLWQEQKDGFLDKEGDIDLMDQYEETKGTMKKTTQLSISQIQSQYGHEPRGKLALSLLNACAFIHAHNISYDFLKTYAHENGYNVAVDLGGAQGALEILLNSSLLEPEYAQTVQGGESMYFMHELTGDVIRGKLDKKTQSEVVTKVLRALSNDSEQNNDIVMAKPSHPYHHHLYTAVQHANSLRVTTLQIADIIGKLGIAYTAQYHGFNKVAYYLQTAINVWEAELKQRTEKDYIPQKLGSSHQNDVSCDEETKQKLIIHNIVLASAELGFAFNEMDDIQSAQKVLIQALGLREQLALEDQYAIAWVYTHLGSGYKYNGRYEEAVKCHLNALEVVSNNKDGLSEEAHFATSVNIGIASLSLGQYQRACEYLNQVSKPEDADKEALHFSTYALSLYFAGDALRLYGDYQAAIHKYTEAIAVFKKLSWEENHLYVLRANERIQLCSIGAVGSAVCRDYITSILKTKIETIGNDHYQTATTYIFIASIYLSDRDYQNALQHYQLAATILEKLYADNHPDKANILSGKGHAQLGLNHNDGVTSAMANFKTALTVQREFLGQEHPDIAFTLYGMAKANFLQGNYSQAAKDIQEACAMYAKFVIPEHRGRREAEQWMLEHDINTMTADIQAISLENTASERRHSFVAEQSIPKYAGPKIN